MSQGSWNAFAGPLRLELRPSRGLALLIWVPYLLAAGVVPGLDVPFAVSVGLLLACGASLVLQHRRHLPGRGTESVRAIEWLPDGRWRLLTGAGRWDAVLALPLYEQPFLVILSFRVAGRRRLLHVVILPDMVDADQFRRLRVRLRIEVPVKRAWRAASAE